MSQMALFRWITLRPHGGSRGRDQVSRTPRHPNGTREPRALLARPLQRERAAPAAAARERGDRRVERTVRRRDAGAAQRREERERARPEASFPHGEYGVFFSWCSVYQPDAETGERTPAERDAYETSATSSLAATLAVVMVTAS